MVIRTDAGEREKSQKGGGKREREEWKGRRGQNLNKSKGIFPSATRKRREKYRKKLSHSINLTQK
jgi:hypothetical protein